MLTQSCWRPGTTTLGWSIVEWFAVAIAGISTWTLGCSASKPAYEPPQENESGYQMLSELQDEIVPIEANDLGVSASVIMAAGRRNLDTEPLTGRFPTGLSVVRVEAATCGDEPEHFLRLITLEDYRSAPWIHTMKDVPAVREVTTLGTYGLDPRGADCRGLLKSSLLNDCELCFVYAEVLETAADAEFLGVLWDAAEEKALAAYRVPVVLTAAERETYEKKHKFAGLKADAESRAMAELQRLVRDTIWEIASKDSGTATTQPSPWQTDLPLYPRDNKASNVRIFINKKQGS
jgi:hypothetical protein